MNRPEVLLDRSLLLHFEYDKPSFGGVDWRTWLMRLGVNGQPVRRGVRFNSCPMVLLAAEAGHGVALHWSYITDPLPAEGRLICPADRTRKCGMAIACAHQAMPTTPPVSLPS